VPSVDQGKDREPESRILEPVERLPALGFPKLSPTGNLLSLTFPDLLGNPLGNNLEDPQQSLGHCWEFTGNSLGIQSVCLEDPR